MTPTSTVRQSMTQRDAASNRPARRPRSRRRYVWRGLLLVGLLLVAYVMVTFVQVWMASRRDGDRSAEAIVVLGAAQYDCRPSPVLQERLDHALGLYEAGTAGTIVVTGGRQEGDRCTEATASADYLLAAGVPDANLLREVQGTNTWESLAASARILRDVGTTDVVLVTDGYHALRVQAIADELGLDASVSPSGNSGSLRDYVEETAAVSVGRIIGFRRLVDLDAQVED
jgi:uncharacterized SAM-binding protein YcdF (DUF218 family)